MQGDSVKPTSKRTLPLPQVHSSVGTLSTPPCCLGCGVGRPASEAQDLWRVREEGFACAPGCFAGSREQGKVVLGVPTEHLATSC